MKIQKIGAAQQMVSAWSGGTTTQVAIAPEEAVYAQRDFLWRISSAVVELPESNFTSLPDYDRILMILEGELVLSHDGGEEYVLKALDQTAFDGASDTYSRGKVTDFNLMMRKNQCTGSVTARVLSQQERWENIFDTVDQTDTQVIYCFRGSVDVAIEQKSVHLDAGDAVRIDFECRDNRTHRCTICGDAVVIAAQIQLTR
ncbi:MAG: HutD family protein [Oscillospiraceae bacterium]|nr:HutD family protein [Oscillospiraceae bacterium]